MNTRDLREALEEKLRSNGQKTMPTKKVGQLRREPSRNPPSAIKYILKGGFPRMNTYVKFGVLMALIVGSLVWLAAGGISDTKTYYKTIPELGKDGRNRPQPAASGRRRCQAGFHREARVRRHLYSAPGCPES